MNKPTTFQFRGWLLLAFAVLFASCSKEAEFSPTGDTGIAGSYAQFMLAGDYLYIIDDSSIKTLEVTDAAQPTLINEREIGFGIESIYRLNERLFIGSSSGLYIYTIGQNGVPEQTSAVSYTGDSPFNRPCDPVVANDSLAFVTLNSSQVSQFCGRTVSIGINELRVYDISDLNEPILIDTVSMSGPKGLGLDGTTLFVCDSDNGLLVLDVSDPANIETIDHKQGFTAYDVIPLGGLLLVVSPNNIYQFDYTDLNNISLVAEIDIQP